MRRHMRRHMRLGLCVGLRLRLHLYLLVYGLLGRLLNARRHLLRRARIHIAGMAQGRAQVRVSRRIVAGLICAHGVPAQTSGAR